MKGNAAEQQEAQVEIRFLEGVKRRLANHEHVLKALGDLYTRAGRLDEGLEADRKLVELCPDDPMVWYNLGCSLVLTGNHAEALDALTHAADIGYSDALWMSRDEDLQALHENARFKQLLRRIRENGEKQHEE